MKELVRHIEYLLQSHDCVIIPGLGAVLCHSESAVYDAATGFWKAPRRVLSFNPELSRTDGLLAMSVSRRDGISVEAAAARVSTATAAMRSELESTGRLSLGSAGELMRTPDGMLNYVPGTAAWLSPAMLWLPSFRLDETVSASALAREVARAEIRHNRWRTALRRVSVAASIVGGVLALAWVVRTAMPSAPTEQYASVVPVPELSVIELADSDRNQPVESTTLANESVEVVEAVESTPAESVDVEQAAPVVEEVAEATVAAADAAESDAEVRLNENDRYFLIVASLTSQSEAEDYIKQHNNFNLGILTVDGRYRVYVATGQSSAAALAAKRGNIARQYPDSWVCRR